MNLSLKVLISATLLCLLFISMNCKFQKNSNKLKKITNRLEQPVQGERIQLENSKISFVIPKDWKHNWDSENKEMIISPPILTPPVEFVKVTEKSLNEDEKKLNINDLLVKQKESILNMSPFPIALTTILGPEEIKLDNLKAGRYIAEANPFGVLLYEGYLGGVKDEENNKLLFLYSAYIKKKSDAIRPGLDMIIKSAKKI